MSSPQYGAFNIRAKTNQVVDHHYDEAKPGKPLYLLIPGGLIALASLALIVYLIYLTFWQGSLSQNDGLTWMAVLAPFYIGGVFLFSYGYELYNVPKALRLTAFIVFITLASVVILAVLLLAVGAMGERESSSSRSSRSRSSSSGGRVGGGGFGLPWPIFLGGFGFPRPTQTVTREVIREVPAAPTAPPPPQPVTCPYCGSTYLPTETDYACPNCGAAAPNDPIATNVSSS
jgi:hypothetical protein